MSNSFATPWAIAHQAPLSIGFSRQEYWSGLPFLSPGYLPDPGIEPRSPTLEADALTSEPPGKPLIHDIKYITNVLPWWLRGKESICPCRQHGFHPWIVKIFWRREWQPTSVLVPGKSHGPRSLEGYSPLGCKESDITYLLNSNKYYKYLLKIIC